MKDENFKMLLIKGGIEKASPGFTNQIVESIRMDAAAFVINPKWKKIFKTAFLSIAVLIIALSFLIKPGKLPFDISSVIKNIPPGNIVYYLSYVVGFWMLVIISQWVDRKNSTNF